MGTKILTNLLMHGSLLTPATHIGKSGKGAIYYESKVGRNHALYLVEVEFEVPVKYVSLGKGSKIILKSLVNVLPGRPLGGHYPLVKDLETILLAIET